MFSKRILFAMVLAGCPPYAMTGGVANALQPICAQVALDDLQGQRDCLAQRAHELCAALQTDQQRSECKETLPVWAQPLKLSNSGNKEIRIVRKPDGIEILNSRGRPIASLPAGSNGNIQIIARRASSDVSANKSLLDLAKPKSNLWSLGEGDGPSIDIGAGAMGGNTPGQPKDGAGSQPNTPQGPTNPTQAGENSDPGGGVTITIHF
jgi:hypothetical protein